MAVATITKSLRGMTGKTMDDGIEYKIGSVRLSDKNLTVDVIANDPTGRSITLRSFPKLRSRPLEAEQATAKEYNDKAIQHALNIVDFYNQGA